MAKQSQFWITTVPKGNLGAIDCFTDGDVLRDSFVRSAYEDAKSQIAAMQRPPMGRIKRMEVSPQAPKPGRVDRETCSTRDAG